MSSSRARRPRTAPSRAGALAALGGDPDALWVRDAGLLFDPHFLGALHGELRAELGDEEAHATLVQIGYLQGLRDALRLLDEPSAPRGQASGTPRSAALPMQLRDASEAAPPGGLSLEGSWPERIEAGARLAAIGVASEPVCAVSAGYTSGWLSGMLDADVLAVETGCAATGAEACRFEARDVESWIANGDPLVPARLEALPFSALRELVHERTPSPELPAASEAPALPGEAAVVHLWGPVMVVPWVGPDEALAAVELVGRDPGAREVSVIVVDLSGAVLDEAFAAAALERLVETVEGRGCELLLAGASPEAAVVLADLERRPLATHKDLSHAVAAAFQIADAQRRLL
jgi:hypothetical protein